MNLNSNPTQKQLHDLLFHCDDAAGGHILWVSKAGEVQITLLDHETPAHWADRMSDQIQFRYETYGSGNGYVGESAANDPEYVLSLFERLWSDWKNDRRGYLDF